MGNYDEQLQGTYGAQLDKALNALEGLLQREDLEAKLATLLTCPSSLHRAEAIIEVHGVEFGRQLYDLLLKGTTLDDAIAQLEAEQETESAHYIAQQRDQEVAWIEAEQQREAIAARYREIEAGWVCWERRGKLTP